jgi:hypothetical protein
MSKLHRAIGTTWVGLGLAVALYSAAAHHSSSMFDHSRLVTISGTVKEVRWVNPHVSILIHGTLEEEGGEAADWLLETTSPGILTRLGWTRTSLKPGDRVRADASPLRDPEEHGGALYSITSLETGKTFGTNNRVQEKPNRE